MGESPGKELVEHHAECIDVGRRGHRLTANLLGSGIGRGEGAGLEVGAIAGISSIVREQFGDPEIEQLDPSLAVDEDVRGLEVAMDDEAPMRHRHGVGDRDQQLESGAQ